MKATPPSQETDPLRFHGISFEGKDHGGGPDLPLGRRGIFVLVHIYYGRGKGKTSAAVGAAVRAAGQGIGVLVVQFMKDARAVSGEVEAMRRLAPAVEMLRAELPYPIARPPNAKARELLKARTRELLLETVCRCASVSPGMVVLDELGIALSRGWLDRGKVEELLACLSGNAEVIITGRRMPRWLLDRGDLVTRLTNMRHPFDSGAPARKGVEF